MMQSSGRDFDLFVIGGGSGGVRCARVSAGHGAHVGIAEERFWGGTCVNVGCVPKKLLVQAGEYGAWAKDAGGFGWTIEAKGHSWSALIAAKDREINRLNAVYARVLESAGVSTFTERAELEDAHTLRVGDRLFTADRIVIATGGQPLRPSIPGATLGIVSDDAFRLSAVPERILLVGGGYIAVEFAGIFRALGSEVDVVYRQPLPLRGFDEDLRDGLAAAMEVAGIRLHPGCSPHDISEREGVKRVRLSDGRVIETDLVFFATGRRPATENLGLEAVGVAATGTGAIVVDQWMRTSVPHIFALGDVTDRLNLTPVATAEGHALADTLFGGNPHVAELDHVPTAVFFSPPLATVGLTEADAALRGPADIYMTRFTPMRHMMTGRDRRTMMKLIVEPASGRVLGAHMLGEDAPEIIQGLAVAITAGATKVDFDRTIGIHPTAAEEFVVLRTKTRTAGEAVAPARAAAE